MRSRDCVPGVSLHDREPDWAPLEDLVPGLVGDFMWMFEVELDNGLRLHAYKHRWSRRYIHIGAEGRPFYYVWGGCPRHDHCYREIGRLEILELVLAPWLKCVHATDEDVERCLDALDRVAGLE
jgi:hypothetical protein